MTRDVKIMMAGVILLLIVAAALWHRQTGIIREQERLEREIKRSPFFDPGTNQM